MCTCTLHAWMNVQYTRHSQTRAHSYTVIRTFKDLYSIQSVSNLTSSCIITPFGRKTVTRKIDILFPLKHSIGYLIFIPKWPSLSTGVLACSNQVQPHKDKQPYAIYFYQQGVILFTAGRCHYLYWQYMFLL